MNNNNEIKLKNLNDFKLIGLNLVNLINENSKFIKEYEILQKEKMNFLHIKKIINNPNYPNQIDLNTNNDKSLKFDYLKENIKRTEILNNFQKIENILNQNFIIPTKVLESILVLLVKMLGNIIEKLDNKRIIKCISNVIKKQIDIFLYQKKLNQLYEILISKKIVENLIKNYLLILETIYQHSDPLKNINKELENREENYIVINWNIDKDLIAEVFSSFNYLYFPLSDSDKISIMPGLISKLVKFFFWNFNKTYNKGDKENNTNANNSKNLISRKILLILYKIINKNLCILINLKIDISNNKNKYTNDFSIDFRNLFNSFEIFFNQIYKLIIENKSENLNVLSIIDLKIKTNYLITPENIEKNDGNINISQSLLDEFSYSCLLMRKLYDSTNSESKLNNSNVMINYNINFEEYFFKFNFIFQKCFFPNFNNNKINFTRPSQRLYNENEDFFYLKKKIDCFKNKHEFLENFESIFTYDQISNNINKNLSYFNEILRKKEFHKIEDIIYKACGLIELYKYKNKINIANSTNINTQEEITIKNNIIGLCWKHVESLLDMFFILKKTKFIEYERTNIELKKNISSNEVYLNNISKLLFQFLISDKCSFNNNKFVPKDITNNSEEINNLISILNFINLIFSDENYDNNDCEEIQIKNYFYINQLFKYILSKSLNYIKTLKKYLTKLNDLKKEIELLNEYIFKVNQSLENNYKDENDWLNNNENKRIDIDNCKKSLKEKYIKMIKIVKENYENLLKILIVIILLFTNTDLNLKHIEYYIIKNFNQQIYYILNNFLISIDFEKYISIIEVFNEDENKIESTLFIELINKNNFSQIYFKLPNLILESEKENIRNKNFLCLKIFQNDLLKSIIMFNFYLILKYQIDNYSKLGELFYDQFEQRQILMFTLTNYSYNCSLLLKLTSTILIRHLNLYDHFTKNIENIKNEKDYLNSNHKINDKNDLKNFIISNFDYLLNSIMKEILYNNYDEKSQEINDSNNKLKNNKYIIIYQKKLDLSNLFYSIILLISELDNHEIKNFYSAQLNNFINKFFIHLDDFIKNKNLFNIDCSLEIFIRIIEYQDKILKENYILFQKQVNTKYKKIENYELNFKYTTKKEEYIEEKRINNFSEYLKNTSNFYNSNIHRRLILRLCPIFLSKNKSFVEKYLEIFMNCFFILFILPLENEENINFSAEDSANVLINNSLGPVLFETWNYFIYNIKNVNDLKSINKISKFIFKINKFLPKFFNEQRIFEDLVPALYSSFTEFLFQNYEISLIINSVFSFLFNLFLMFFFNLKNSENNHTEFLLLFSNFDEEEITNENKIVEKRKHIIKNMKFFTNMHNREILKNFILKIIKFYGKKLNNYKITQLHYFIELTQETNKSKKNIIKDFNDKISEDCILSDNENIFFDYIGLETKDNFNICGSKYNIQDICLYYQIKKIIVEVLKEDNLTIYTYLNNLCNIFE